MRGFFRFLCMTFGIMPLLPLTGGQAAVVTNAFVTSYAVTTNGVGNRAITFQLSPTGVVEVVPFAPDLVRVRFHFAGLYEREEIAIDQPYSNWPSFSHAISATATNLLIETDVLHISIVLSNRFQVHFLDPSGHDLLRDGQIEYNDTYQQITDTLAYEQVSWPGESTSVSNFPTGFKVRSVKERAADEAFFGLGDTAGPLNRRGRSIQFWAQDTYQFGEGRTPKYTALPMVYGVRGADTNHPAFAYGLFFNNPARPVFHLDGPDNTWSFEAGDDQLDYFFFGGGSDHTMISVIDRFSELTGRPAMLPKWAMGFHQSRHSYFTQDRAQEIALAMRTNDFPCDAIYLDIGSQMEVGGQSAQFTFNSNYTNVPGLVQYAGDLGMKLVPLIEPLLTTNDPLYGEAFTNLYFLKNNDLSTFVGTNFLGRISWLDFSIDSTVNWWTGQLTNYLANYGFEGIWNDLNEPNENAMPLDTVWFLEGRYGGGLVTNDSRKWHAINKNTYNMWEVQVTVDALRAHAPEKRPFVLSRGAWPGIQKLAAGWSGDNKSSFDHLRFNVPLGLNVMISGQTWFGHDVGGFVDDTSAELLTRWTQSGALNPMFRNHSTLNTIDQEPWVFGETHALWNRRWIKFRYQLMPYLYSLACASATNGVPINAPTVFYFQSDTNTFSRNDYDYMVGRDLLVAPVYSNNAKSRVVYLPSGHAWYAWESGARYAGGVSVHVPASLGSLPLFTRAGAIIPRGPVQYYANEFQPDFLDILHWPGGTNLFVLTEDDGETTNHLAGVIAQTVLTSVSETNQLTFTIGTRTGSYDPGARDFYLLMMDANPVDAVMVNSGLIARVANRAEAEASVDPAWSYDAFHRLLVVKVPGDGTHQVVQADFTPFIDTDGDGMPDDWEETFFGGSTNATATANPDGDSWNNLQEYQAGNHPLMYEAITASYTNMAVAGTFTFWNEKANNMRLVGSNRWAYVADLTGATNIEFKFVANSDWGSGNWGDNLQTVTVPPIVNQQAFGSGANIQLTGSYTGWYTFSFTYSSNNLNNIRYSVTAAEQTDSDGDGINDALEAYYGMNPYSAADAAMDEDADAFSFVEEAVAGTSPIRADSFHSVTGLVDSSGGGSIVSWNAVTGRTYQILISTNLLDVPAWSPLPPYTNLSGSGPVSITDTSGLPFSLYRIDVQKP